jgi:hypothetical protein
MNGFSRRQDLGKCMAEFTKPFRRAPVRHFDHDQIAAARAWMAEP